MNDQSKNGKPFFFCRFINALMYCHLPEKEKICDLYRALKTDSLFFLHCSCSTAMTTTKFQIFQVEYDLNLLAKRKIFPPPSLVFTLLCSYLLLSHHAPSALFPHQAALLSYQCQMGKRRKSFLPFFFSTFFFGNNVF